MNDIPAKAPCTPRWLSVPFWGLMHLFVLVTPATYALLEGGSSALLLLAAVASSLALSLNHRDFISRLTRDELAFCFALALPLFVALASEATHGEIIWRTLDSPSRFLLGIPVF